MPITLKSGMKGQTVTLLQQRLREHGFGIKVDGLFGPNTEAAVQSFQAAHNINPDGVVGTLTWNLLLSIDSIMLPMRTLLELRKDLIQQVPKDVPATVFAVLQAAISKAGCREFPSGSNTGPEIEEITGKAPSPYYEYWKVKATGMPPWCALFVSWALKTGTKADTWTDIPFGNWFGGVAQIEAWTTANHRWTEQPLPGCIFTISREGASSDPAQAPSAGHTGFVVAVLQQGTEILTIEGNVSNQVASHRRKVSDCRGFIQWW